MLPSTASTAQAEAAYEAAFAAGEREEQALRECCSSCGGPVAIIGWERDYVTRPCRPHREVLADVLAVRCGECGEREHRT